MTDNDDFFADLERELVEATTDRRRRLRRARARRTATLSTILVAVLAAGGGLAAAITTNDNDNNNNSGAPAGRVTPTQNSATRPDPGTVTVAVLNGTTLPGRARGVANLLQNRHYKIGNVTNAATQDSIDTQVYYADVACIPQATEVAHALGLTGEVTVLEAPKGLRTIAGRQAQVIVLVGADQNPRTPNHPAGGH
jgi:LytR cell envelope-related transcriptional attenuator